MLPTATKPNVVEDKPRRCFRHALRVHYEDTDAGGVVYHSNYLAFAERARSELLRELGFGLRQLVEEFDLVWVVRAASARYRRPAFLDDWLVVESRYRRCSPLRFAFAQRIKREDALLAVIDIDLAAVSSRGRPLRRLPAVVAKALDAVRFENEDGETKPHSLYSRVGGGTANTSTQLRAVKPGEGSR